MRIFERVLPILLLALLASTARADTIHLKNGSVLKGKVTSFSDEQFVVMLDTGSGRYLSRALVYMGDVSRIEFDGAPGPVSIPGASAAPEERRPADPPLRGAENVVEEPREESIPERVQGAAESATRVPPRREPVGEPPVTIPSPKSVSGDDDARTRRPSGRVRTASIDVAGRRDWTSTGLIVKRGDVIRIAATGTITLDPVTGAMSGPSGVETSDPRKLMMDRPTGALIAVIGADNDDFIFIGDAADFTARRDGLLFLSVNEGTLSDNEGQYKALIEVESQSTR